MKHTINQGTSSELTYYTANITAEQLSDLDLLAADLFEMGWEKESKLLEDLARTCRDDLPW